jgi:amidase
VSSIEVLKAFIGRIDTVNGQVNAVTHLLDKEAMIAAKQADKTLAKGETLGPLHGVPVSIKENIDVAGSATSVGVAAFKNNIAPVDSAEVSSLRKAGAIPFARTNCPDFVVRWHTHSSAYGQTFNPWNRSHTTGGSSGGEAVALATGMTPLGVGTDLGGSLRYPAQCCGISSLKPTLGRIAQSNHFAGAGSISNQMFGVSGPMARHVRDLRLAYQVMTQQDPRDPWWTPAPVTYGATGAPVRVGVCLNLGNVAVDPDVVAGVKRAASALVSAGYLVEEVEAPALQEAADLWASVMTQEIREYLLETMEENAFADGAAMARNMTKVIPELDYHGYVAAFTERHEIARQWSEFAQRYPLILGPVSTRPPFIVGEDAKSEESISAVLQSMRMVVSMNLLGLPVVTLPTGLAKGLPQSVQVIGERYHESLCLQAAEQIENALGQITPIDPAS